MQEPLARPAGLDADRFVTEALTFFASDQRETARFLDWSGLDAADLRSAAASDGFTLGLLDYFAETLPALDRLCAAAGLDPAAVLRLHAGLRVHGLGSHDEP